MTSMSGVTRGTTQASRHDDANEAARLAALERYGILGTDREAVFDDIAELAAELLEAPVAMVSFIAADRQWLKAEHGIGVRELPLDVSICRDILLEPGVTVVPDLTVDARFSGNSLVTAEDGMRFYAGAPLRTAEGWSLGTVSVLDREARPAGLAPRQERALRALAAQVMAHLELRRAAAAAREDASRFHALFEQSAIGALHLDLSGRWTRVSRRVAAMLGHDAPSDLVGRTCFDLTPPEDQQADGSLLRRLAAGEISFYRRAKRYLRRDGAPLPVEVTVSLIRDDAGAPSYASAIVEDLSERRAAEAALVAAARRSAFLLGIETRLRGIAEADSIADAGAEAIGRHLGVAQVGLAEVEAGTTHAVIRRAWTDGRIPSVTGTWQMADFGPALIGAISAGQTVAIADISIDPRTSHPEVLEAYAATRTRSLLVVPLLRGGRLAASLFLHHPEPRPWTPEDIVTVEEAAARIWAAMDRARAEAIEAEHTRLLGLIAGGEPLAECLSAVTASVTRLEPSTRAAVLLADAARTSFESTVAARIPASFGERISGAMIEEMAIGTCGTAVHRGEPVVCRNIATDGDWAPEWRALCLAHGLRAVHSEPVMGAEGRAVASLALYLDAAREPTGRERQVARFAAQLAAIAIGRDRADRELRVRAAHHGLFFHLLDVLRRTDDAEAIMQAAAVAIGEQLGADRAGFVMAGDDGTMTFRSGWSAGTLPFLTGTAPATAIDPRMIAEALAGQTYTFANTREAAAAPARFDEAGVMAGIGAPILRNGAWHAALYVHAATPRAWTPDETSLVREVAELCRDAMERAQAATALRESEARLRLATEAAEVGFWDRNVQEGILIWPARVKAMFGISAETPASLEDFHERIHPEDREATVAAFSAAADPDRRALYDVQYRTIGKEDGVVRWVAAKGRGIFDAEGRCIRVLGTAVDMTARRRAEQALADSRRELQQINEGLEARIRDEVAAREAAQAQLVHAQRMEALGQLAGGIAHDFNNVLQAVQGGARLIQSRADNPERIRQLAVMIADAAGRGASVTRRLLAFSRRGDLRAEPVKSATLLADLRDILAHTLGAGISIRVQVPAGLPPLLADKGQLETVLVNLAANARDAMGGTGVLTLSAAMDSADAASRPRGLAPGAYVRIAVLDTGGGMDAATLARASEPFFTTKPRGEGTGLGLAMARGFAEQSNGALEIESAPGRGTTVRLWFPVAEGDAVEDEEESGENGAPDGSPRLLLVDDEVLVREITAQGLEAAGFAVLSVGSGAEAVELLRTAERVDVLVSDLSMPGMDGLKLIGAAQKLRPGLPAILLTGFATDAAELAMGGVISGSFSLLRKPVEAETLAERASVLLTAMSSGK